MGNMSYCRWQNTKNDLEDCAEHITDRLTTDEAKARISLLETALTMLAELGLDADAETADIKKAIEDRQTGYGGEDE